VRNFRLFAAGQTVSLTGTWMQRIAQDWLVLEMSHNDGRALGLTTACQFFPYLVLALHGGALADRHSKRTLLIGTQASMGALALALGLLDAGGVVRLWHVYLLATLLGVVTALDSPIRQSFFIELVGPEVLSNAVSLNSATFNLGRIAGPVLAGLLIGGAGHTWPVFVINAATFGATIVSLLLMRSDQIVPAPRSAIAPGQIREAIRQVRGDPHLLLPIVLVATAATFGMNTLPILVGVMARSTFHTGANGFGLLTTFLAVGSLVGALAGARMTRPDLRVLTTAGIALGLLQMVAGLAPNYVSFACALAPVGVATYLVITTANSCVQLAAPVGMRGRIMAIYLVAFFGPSPLGGILIGAGSSAFGPRATLLLCGAVAAAVALLSTMLARRTR
jgi:MFS family permease